MPSLTRERLCTREVNRVWWSVRDEVSVPRLRRLRGVGGEGVFEVFVRTLPFSPITRRGTHQAILAYHRRGGRQRLS